MLNVTTANGPSLYVGNKKISGSGRTGAQTNTGGIGGVIGRLVGHDLTPGFNIDAHAGGGIPFISRGNGSTGIAPAPVRKTTSATHPNSKSTSATTYSGGSSDSGPSAQDLAAYNTYQNEAHGDLDRLLHSYNATKDSLNSSYGVRANQLESAKAHAQDNYNDSVTDQNQNLLRQQNQVRQGVHDAYQNLMNLLGAYGGGGTSVAQEWAPTAAQHFQNVQLGDANQNTAANLRHLNTNWGNYLQDYRDEKSQLADTHNQDIANAKSQYADTRDKLNLILSRIGSHAVDPGVIGSALGALDIPHINYVRPTYTGNTPVYNAPNLSTFEASAPTANFASPGSVSNTAATPALAYLLDQQKRQQPAVA
jgi:hypothetical protein